MHDLRKNYRVSSPETAVLSHPISPQGRLALSKPSCVLSTGML